MNFQVEGFRIEDKDYTIVGYSLSLKIYFLVKLQKLKTINLGKKVNEGHFNINVPINNINWNIDTTLDSRPFSIQSNIDEDLFKNKFFPYKKFEIPSIIWQCIVGSIVTEL